MIQKVIIYYALRQPHVVARLRDELDAADLSYTVPYKQTWQLAYLDAIVQEALRIHPPISGLLERAVPKPGLLLPDGRATPPGTIVGMNQWAITRNKEVFGHDAEDFCPERWLVENDKCETDYRVRLRRMKDVAGFGFGGGNRACIGKRLPRAELYKTTATLFGKYNVRRTDCLRCCRSGPNHAYR